MQLLVWHCASLVSTVVSPCEGADVLPDAEIGVPETYSDCLYAMVTVQPGDRAGKCWKAAKGVRAISAHADTKLVVVNAYAHLGPLNADLPLTRQMLDQLVTRLDESVGLDISTLPFGWRKRLQLDVHDHEWAQRSIYV